MILQWRRTLQQHILIELLPKRKYLCNICVISGQPNIANLVVTHSY